MGDDVKRSTRTALCRCEQCGHTARALAVNIPIGCPEPVTVRCGWTNIAHCEAARMVHQVSDRPMDGGRDG